MTHSFYMITALKEEISQFVQSAGFKRYFKNTSWMLGGKLLQLIATFWVTAKVAKYLGPDQFGLWGYAQSVGVLFIVLAGMGLKQIVSRNLVNHPEQEKKILGTSIFLRLIGAISGLIIYSLMTVFLGDSWVVMGLIYLVIGSAFFQVFEVFDFFFQGQVKAKFGVQIQFVSVIIFALIQLILIIIEAPLIWFGFAFFLRNIIVGVGLTWMYQVKTRNLFQLNVDWAYGKELIRDSWPLIFSGMVVIIYMKVDQIMLMKMVSSQAVGYYTSALRFSEVWFFLGPVLARSLFPAIINAKKRDQKLYRSRLQNYYNLSVWLALAISIPVALIGPWLLRQEFLFGEAFTPSGPVLVIHVWSLVFVFLGIASSEHLAVENLQIVSLYRSIAGLIVNVLLNLWLISWIGIIGAAIATLFSQAVASYIGYLLSRKTWHIFLMQTRALTFYSIIKKIKS